VTVEQRRLQEQSVHHLRWQECSGDMPRKIVDKHERGRYWSWSRIGKVEGGAVRNTHTKRGTLVITITVATFKSVITLLLT